MILPTDTQSEEYVAIIDQDKVTDEVRNIAVKYDPLNRSGHEGFHVTDEGDLHIDDSKVMREHKLIEKKIPNDAIRIVPLPSETGQLVHQYGENGFRLYNLPAPDEGSVIGLLGRNGIGKTTALRILAGELVPNFGTPDGASWDRAIESFRGTTLQTHLERLRDGSVITAYKSQRVDSLSDTDGETVRQRLTSRSTDPGRLVDELGLRSISDRSLGDLSGGERQRVAIATTLLSDADLYLFDEPSSFLDAKQRSTVSQVIHERVRDTDASAIVIEHDLAMLDLLSDGIHILYGDSGGFGVVSQRLSVRAGINQFLDGYLTEENVQIRGDAIEFPSASERGSPNEDTIFEYPRLQKEFPGFALSVDPGQIYAGESIGIVGENALGKTTFVKLLAGSIEADSGAVQGTLSVSYKPQYMTPDSQETVHEQFTAVTDTHSRRFKTWIRDPFDLEVLYDRPLDSLSGGELQRVGIALCLARDADLYLIDEPSAFLDVDRRVSLADEIHRFSKRTDHPILVVDHDLFVIDRVADRLVVFEGSPGDHGHANPPQSVRDGMNAFLSSLEITFRRDERTGRPRVNKPGSQLDREQKSNGEYYYDN
ncbi:ribosome biogenesis/translation initiation ATPase RLI [Haloplanus aerogenes]|uniref:Ribosome biogenesis/translation initiation ATPase RLI n=1 Tax=Haloplanus aerogenes TaxID=660522 RepID=A0A3M0CQ22_9EURY|nr:ribosome biogenesis/translation initiation ATPase RLI [Haloplanus aerogenes]AZH25990.1 ribosome biogenesis/translation initiation ATPase RLI [Haloplanus aerogenes]RMB11691.1 translation initiation factor RLI1 [Haloplanus aerogenes]